MAGRLVSARLPNAWYQAHFRARRWKVQCVPGATCGTTLGLPACRAPVPRGTAEAYGAQLCQALPERLGIRRCPGGGGGGRGC